MKRKRDEKFIHDCSKNGMRGIVVVAQLKKKIPIYWLKPTKEKNIYKYVYPGG